MQNVVDVTFPRMSKQIDDFAKNAAGAIWFIRDDGKEVHWNLRSDVEGIRLWRKQAYEMATALTGLAGDVASFYNISQTRPIQS